LIADCYPSSTFSCAHSQLESVLHHEQLPRGNDRLFQHHTHTRTEPTAVKEKGETEEGGWRRESIVTQEHQHSGAPTSREWVLPRPSAGLAGGSGQDRTSRVGS
jgi:hypothetical protein